MKALQTRAAGPFVGPVFAAAVLMAATMGTRSSLGLFIGPMNSTTGLGVATLSLAFALGHLAWGGAQPVAGAIAQSMGPTRVILGGGLIASAALALAAAMDGAVALTGSLLVSGAAGAAAGGAPLLMGAVAQRVESGRRGLALGLVSAGASAGPMLLAPLAAALIGALGWRSAMLGFAALSLLVLPAAAMLRRPAPPEETALGPAPTARHALRQSNYWLVTAGFFVCGFHVAFLTSHMPGVLQLCGFSTSFAGWWLAVVGACNIVGSLASGWIMQRVPMERLLCSLYLLRALGIALFLLLPSSAEVMLGFALWMGLTYMATLPPTTGIIAELYGARLVPVLFGITMGMHQVGSFLGVWLGGLEVQLTGAYRFIWVFDLTLAAAAALLHLPIKRQPQQAERSLAPVCPSTGAAR